jgi:hypothetical protein
MDPFWAPLAFYAGLTVVGGVLMAIGMAFEDHPEISRVFFGLGGVLAATGIGSAAFHLVGSLIEHLT